MDVNVLLLVFVNLFLSDWNGSVIVLKVDVLVFVLVVDLFLGGCI